MNDNYNQNQNAHVGGNQQTGDPNTGVGQNGNTNQQQDSNVNWEQSARYFQSEKDKLAAENQKLSKYAQLGQALASRPDIVNNIKAQLSGQPAINPAPKPARIEMDSDEFDAWEAYNDPNSKSYKYRVQQSQQEINQAVAQKVGPALQQQKRQQAMMQQAMREQQGVAQLRKDLGQRGFDEAKQQRFIEFMSKNPGEYGVDVVAKMFDAVDGQIPQSPNPNDQVRQTQSMPSPGGILNGQQPQRRSDGDNLWDQVMNADRMNGGKLP